MKCEEKVGDMCKRAIKYNKFLKSERCEHCCFKCVHAIDMDCSDVCADVAEYYHPEEGEKC